METENYSAQSGGGQDLLRELGRRLRRTREERDLTVAELARRSGLSRRHVTEAEAGRANLSVVKLAALAEVLGLPVARLLETGPAPARGGRVALVGLRGAGKSSVGRALALALEVPFVELDRRVEELAGLGVAAIFELHGAAGFRRFEAEALERVLAGGDRMVLATGGSIVASETNFARLRETCHTVWLRASPEAHLERVRAQGDRRPMRGHPRALDEIRGILEERREAHGLCEVEVDTDGASVEGIAARLARRFGP